MQIEIITFCDAAKDYFGRVSIIGATDTIVGGSFPMQIDHCALVMRFRVSRIEEGKHQVRVVIMDTDGKAVVNLDGQMNIRFPEGASSAGANLVININGLRIQGPGEHSINVAVDGIETGSAPLYVRQGRVRPDPEGKEGPSLN